MRDDHEPSVNDIWKAIIEVHNESKALSLLCEEIEPRQFKAFIQPYNELRHAYEHTIRCMANRFGMANKQPSESYQQRSLNKALGHEYRGFFDCADWLAIILREAVQKTLYPYSAACILASLPDYYSRDRIRILEISEEIARLRGDKDIAKQGGDADEREERDESAADDSLASLEQVRKYKAVLSELRAVQKKVMLAVPGLIDYKRRATRDGRRQVGVIGGLILAVVLGGVQHLWTAIAGKPTPSDSITNDTRQSKKPASSDASHPAAPNSPAVPNKHHTGTPTSHCRLGTKNLLDEMAA
jgi:hypothetical protein